MRRQEIAGAVVAACLLVAAQSAIAADPDTVRILVPTFGGSTGLGGNVATILALRIWTTFRPRPPGANPQDLYFGRGEFAWSRRVVEDSPRRLCRRPPRPAATWRCGAARPNMGRGWS